MKRIDMYMHELACRDIERMMDADPAGAEELLDILFTSLQTPGELWQHSLPMQEDADLLSLGYRFVPVGNVTLFFKYTRGKWMIRRVAQGRRKSEWMLR